MSLKAIIAVGACIGIGVIIGAGAVWILTQPTIDDLKRRIKLLEDRIYEFQTRYENDLNAIREEYNILNNQIQELKKTTLTADMKQKVEMLFCTLDQVYQTKQEERERPAQIYIS